MSGPGERVGLEFGVAQGVERGCVADSDVVVLIDVDPLEEGLAIAVLGPIR
ncbi:MAG: hypothetical protein QM628_03580 [Propionicimonas sp.]|jgi:hypothetical protein